MLSTSEGRWVAIESIQRDRQPAPVYNLTVDYWHTYFLGTPAWGFDIWVHNNHHVRVSSLAKDLLNGHDVRVKSIRQADAVLKEALPNGRKVTGTGPRQSGPPDWTKFKGKDANGIYHKDYQFDPNTGRIYGHGPGNPHGAFKHINVKLPDGRKVTIIIEPN